MNDFKYKLEQVRGGCVAMLRLASDGELKPILQKGGHPQVFPTTEAAVIALLDNVMAYVNGHLVRDGEIAGRTRAEIESHFKAPLRQKGKTRLIEVSHKGQRRRCAESSNRNPLYEA